MGTVIAAVPDTVYAFAAKPENLPKWAAGLAEADVKRDAAMVEADPARLKTILEGHPRRS